MGDNETCKVTDFGMARENDYERKAEVSTVAGYFCTLVQVQLYNATFTNT